MLAREETMASPVLGDEITRAYPVVEMDGSDSSMLDNTLEFLMYSGIELPKAVMLCIPKVGRIFLADISSHFCAFPLGKFHSGVLSGTDHST